MSVIGKVSAIFTASSAGMVSGTRAAGGALNRLQASVDSLRSSTGALVAMQGAQFFGSIASQAGHYASQLVSMGQAQAETIDNMSKLAARTGYTYEEMAGLSLAADLAGVSTEKLAGAMQRADRNFVMAKNGSKSAAEAFRLAGVNFEDLKSLSDAERFEFLAEAISKIPDAATRSAAAIQIFGRAGAELMPLFAGGAAGIREARGQAERLGLALTTVQGQNVEAMNDAFTLAGKAISGVVQQVVAYLAPGIQAVADAFTEFVGTIGGANIGQAIGEGILEGAKFLAGVGDWIIGGFQQTFGLLESVGLSWENIIGLMGRVFSFASGVFNAGQTALSLVLLSLGKVVEGFARIVDGAANMLGLGGGWTETFLDSVKSANDAIQANMVQNSREAAAGFAGALGQEFNAGGEAGPLTSLLSRAEAAIGRAGQATNGAAANMGRVAADIAEAPSAIDAALENAAKSSAKKAGEREKQEKKAREAAEELPALKGIDSRSSEGISEMFRFMRMKGQGGGNNVEEKQLGALEAIRRNTAAAGEFYAVEF